MGNENKTVIEYFLWAKDDQNSDKLVYYDQEGHYYEKSVPASFVEEALKVFDGQPRSIRRTTGGLVLAEPYQMVLYENNHGISSLPPRIGIRVKFTDLNRSERGEAKDCSLVTHTKVVALSELRAAFTVDANRSAPYLIEAGKGLLPIKVFHVSQKGTEKWAHFVIQNELELIAVQPKEVKYLLQTYSVPIEVIRQGEQTPSGASPEINLSVSNASQMMRAGEQMLPSALKDSPAIPIPCGSAPTLVEHFLRIAKEPVPTESAASLLINIQKEEETLLPFGLFEAP